MAKVKKSTEEVQRLRPALTPESREKQMIALAYDVVEERLLKRTASSQETTHFLKLGSIRAQLELEKLKAENKLLEAKTDQIESQAKSEELYKEAIEAMKRYSGHGDA